MKLGVSYIVFDGIELLEHSIKQIRPHVNYIQVIYQTHSWFGRAMQKEDLDELNRLHKLRLIDELTLFKGFVPLRDHSQGSIRVAKQYETAKRQLGLASCLKKGCTHFLCMDVDEFYVSKEFKEAKDQIIKEDLDSTAVRFINYVNIPTMHRGADGMTVPFICKIDKTSKLGRTFFTRCDPTRGITTPTSKKRVLLFHPSKIKMHHMETVRKNLFLKYESTTRSIFNRARTGDLVNNIRLVKEDTSTFGFNRIICPSVNGVKLTKVENIFNIPYESWIKHR